MKKLHILAPDVISTIAPEIYGHFAEHIGGVIYDGLWVGKDSKIPNIRGFRKELVEKFRRIKPSVVRWPGGCFAETYNWRDGIGENRPTRLNWWYPHDKRPESNEVGTHEFMDFCEMVGTKPYMAMNITSITPMQARDWMDYCLSPRGSTTLALEREKNGHPEPFDIPFWGVGNENWGGGGNMTADFYALEFRRFSTLLGNITKSFGGKLITGGANGREYSWTQDLVKNLFTSEKHVNGMSIHCYAGTKFEALDMSEAAWNDTMMRADRIETVLTRHYAFVQAYGMENNLKLVIDEWGCWYPEGSGPSKGYNLFEQQSSMKDAVVTAHSLNIFNRHCDKILMTNVAQLCNNLHCLFLAGGEHCITTPTYHVFDMYKEHQGAQSLKCIVEDNENLEEKLSVSASQKDGKLLITLANLSREKDLEIDCNILGISTAEKAKGKLLSEENPATHNSFEEPDRVIPKNVEVDLREKIRLPHASVLSLNVELL